MTATTLRAAILMPVFRDWHSAALLCARLDAELARLPAVSARILLVDDGTPEGVEWPPAAPCHALARIDVLRLRRNLGHQRAIAEGLCYIDEHLPCDAVLVMDADGEDRPEDAARLIGLFLAQPARPIFAERRKRHEGAVFQTGYNLYRLVHRLLTGISVRVGNFSILPYAAVRRLVTMPELWNHFAGAVFKSRLPFDCVPIDRGRRLCGQSHMNLPALVAHGIAGVATFQETVATRILILNAASLVLLTLLLALIVIVRLATRLAIPGWATYTAGLVLVLAVQMMAISFSLLFTLIANRTANSFVPRRDYALFIDRIDCLAERS
ncbi:MAG: glycosyltransferase [Acidobacteriota bacterium]|nr:glycosyltransferase [Acidobacteriota bacterium]